MALPPISLVKTLFGGFLMGIANIIPGVSGGTIILALGLYPRFVEGVADATRLRWRPASLTFLALLIFAAVVAIVIMAGPISAGLRSAHHILYALFIGLTLGGVPLLWRDLKPLTPATVVGIAAGLGVMILVLLLRDSNLPQNFIVLLIAGIIVSAAMVLPGISGSYLLLIFGLYLPVTTAIKDFVSAVRAVNFGDAWSLGLSVLLPVGIGVLIGIAGLTNLLRALLDRQRRPTIAVLLGLLLGSVIGLYPFGALTEKGELIASAHPMTFTNVVLVLVSLVVGFAITVGVSRLGGRTSLKS